MLRIYNDRLRFSRDDLVPIYVHIISCLDSGGCRYREAVCCGKEHLIFLVRSGVPLQAALELELHLPLVGAVDSLFDLWLLLSAAFN